MRPITVGVSFKMYFGHREAAAWFARVAELARGHAALNSGAVELFVVPTFLQILPAREAFAGTPVRIGAQDVATADAGAYTGEVSAAELAEVGVSLAEIGHAERRRLYSETDDIAAEKAAAALRHGVTPLLCVGETEHFDAPGAAAATVAQLRRSLSGAPAGPVIIAYEPVWAIGAAEPAPAAHIAAVARALRTALDCAPENHAPENHAASENHAPDRAGSSVIYGGSAGPGLLTQLGDAVDGLFLGRFAHDPANLLEVVDEAAALATVRAAA